MNRDVWDRIKVLLKSFGTEKNSLDAVWKLLYTAIGYISSIFAFAVLLKDLAGFDKAEILCKNYWLGLVLIGLLLLLFTIMKKYLAKEQWKMPICRLKLK